MLSKKKLQVNYYRTGDPGATQFKLFLAMTRDLQLTYDYPPNSLFA